MTDYSLWEVILNGDSPIPTRVIDGVVQPVAPTTAKQRLERLISQLEILRESLSQEDINLKFLRSLLTEWRTHTLIWKNKTDLEDQSLDDLFNSLKIYKAEVKSSSSTSPTTQIAFVSSQNTDSTNESVSAVASVSAASAKVPVYALPNVDTLSDAQIDADDLEEMDLKWHITMLTIRARRFLQRTGTNLRANGTTSIRFDMSNVECYNCHRRWHFAKECSVMVLEAMIRAFRQKKNQPTMPLWHSPPQVLPILIMSKQERDELKLKLENFQTSSKNLSQLLASQTNDKTGLGYDNQVFSSSVFDCDEMFSSESDVRTFMPPNPDLVFHDAATVNETIPTAFNVELSPTKPDKVLSQSNSPFASLIEDWVSDSKDDSEGEHKHTQIAPTCVQPTEHVKTPRPSVKTIEHPILGDHPKKDFPKSKVHSKNRNRKACFVCKSLTHLIKDCDYYEKKIVQTPARNHAQRGNHQHYASTTHPNPYRHFVPTLVLTKSKLVPLTAARPVTTAVPHNNVIRPMPTITVVAKPHSPPRRTINLRPSVIL
nr:hypothetical protein [Tanacetum cinerariifolium]